MDQMPCDQAKKCRKQSNHDVQLFRALKETTNIEQLTCLALTRVNLRFIDDGIIGELSHLEIFDVSYNKLKVLPECIGLLEYLTVLNVAGNNLPTLPKSLTNCKKLRNVNACSNNFVNLPNCLIQSLELITRLNISWNDFQEIEQPACLPNLVELNVSHNRLKFYPQWIWSVECCNVENLNMSCIPGKTSMRFFRNVQSKLTNVFLSVRKLDLSNCNLNEKCAKFISFFKKLDEIHLGNSTPYSYKWKWIPVNAFYDFPSAIKGMQHLTHLEMPNVGSLILNSIPNSLSTLTRINLDNNDVSHLPSEFGLLTNLRECVLSNNCLYSLPVEFGELKNLEDLDLSGNRLDGHFHESFSNLQKLKYLDLYDNYIEELPSQIFSFAHLIGLDLSLNYMKFTERTLSCFDLIDDDYPALERRLRVFKRKCRPGSMLSKEKEEEPLDCEGYRIYSSGDIESEDSTSNEVECAKKETNENDKVDCSLIVNENWDTDCEDNFKDTSEPAPKNFSRKSVDYWMIRDSEEDRYNPAECHPMRHLTSFLGEHGEPAEGQFDDAEL